MSITPSVKDEPTTPQSPPVPKRIRATMSKKAGINFPVARIGTMLRNDRYVKRYSKLTSVYLASILEYLSTEIIEKAGQATLDAGRNIIQSRDLLKGIQDDGPLTNLLGGKNSLQIASAGWVQPRPRM
ncbi:histone-fold-containing protein [Absidia repens]|uniref:Histone H2A n=1 Tax=Absidia repens TaxID=90262 RepID=A0A1X2HYB2_9FUNG|nr:histone-fold-containing protein [Absidia repens]